MSEEGRGRRKRALIDREVIINGIIRAEALDISEDGLYIYTQANFIPGAIFEASFKINNENIKAMARVQHVQPNVGVGVKFVELSAPDADKIKQFLEE